MGREVLASMEGNNFFFVKIKDKMWLCFVFSTYKRRSIGTLKDNNFHIIYQYLRFDKSMILLFEVVGGITAITVRLPFPEWNPDPEFRIKQLVKGLNGFRVVKFVTGLKGLIVLPLLEMFMPLVNGLRGFLNRVIPPELWWLIGLIICDRLWGLILIKDAALGIFKWLPALIGLCRRIIFWRSTASQALLRSIKDVEAGRFKEFSFSFWLFTVWSKLNPVIKRFFNGLANSDELVDLIIRQGCSGSSSGMFNKFFPTANNEFLCLVAGKELMASFERSSVNR